MPTERNSAEADSAKEHDLVFDQHLKRIVGKDDSEPVELTVREIKALLALRGRALASRHK